MDVGTMEEIAADLYRATRLDIASPPLMLVLGERLLGRGSIRWVHRKSFRGQAAIVKLHGAWRVYVRHDMPRPRANFAVAHELAHWVLRDEPETTDTEALCDALGATLLAPRPAYCRALEESASYSKVAKWLMCTETCAALRFGEVTGKPLALVAPATVRTRGAPYSWPSEPILRELAEKRRVPGLRKAKLRDEPGRVVLRGVD